MAESLQMFAKILDTAGRPLSKRVRLTVQVKDLGNRGRVVRGSFRRQRSVPFMTGDRFLVQLPQESAKQLGIDGPVPAVAFPKGKSVDFQVCKPLA